MSSSTTTTSVTTSNNSKKRSTLFKGVKWGTFSNQLKDYNSKKKTGKKRSLKSFSNYILKHPSKFHRQTVKRATFYKNVIKPTKK